MGAPQPPQNEKQSPINQLKQLIKLSERMLDAARQNAWDEVVELEKQRRELMSCFFDGKNNKSLSVATLREGLQKLQGIENQLVSIAMKAQETTMQDLQGLGTSRRAVNAYTKNSAP